MSDLTTEQGMFEWLQSSRYRLGKQVSTVERLPEGVTGFVYRAHLQNSDRASIIVKHAEGYAARSSSWKLDQTRMNYEYQALKYLAEMHSEPDLRIRTPEVLFYDANDYVLVMEDVGSLPSVKGWLQAGIDADLAESAGQSLGRYLATIHNMTGEAEDVKNLFNDNTTAKRLSSTVYFGRLQSAAAAFGHTDDFISDVAATGELEVNGAKDVLTLGDFWTGNVLIDDTTSDGPQLCIVDLELAKPGTAAFDIGQMAAEMYCLQLFRDHEAGKSLLEAFLSSYREARDTDVDAAKVAIRIGAHLLVIMPRAWSSETSDDRIKDVVAHGVELIRIGWYRDALGLRNSIVRSLMT